MNASKRRITVVWTLVELLWLMLSFGVLLTIPRLSRVAGGRSGIAQEARVRTADDSVRTIRRRDGSLEDPLRQAEAKNATLGRPLNDWRDPQVPALAIRAQQAEARAQALESQNQRLASQIQEAQSEQTEAARRYAALLASWTTATAQQQQAELSVRKELLGLRGKLQRTVLVIDRSGSMELPRPGADDEELRWPFVQRVVETWIRHLPVEQVKLVVFSTSAEVYPDPADEYLNLTGQSGDANRRALVEVLAGLKPEGSTNTLGALRLAYQCPGVDTMVLLTDGAPNSGRKRFDWVAADQVLKLVQQHGTAVPINVVALGDYFDPDMGSFLLQITATTGGKFLGM